MNLPPFSVSWDYRCPFARNAHEHLVTGLRAGAPWDVTFTPFSLSQIHVGEGEPSVWEQPEKAPELLALNAGVVVRDRFADHFLEAHEALFAARHDKSADIREPEVVRAALDSAGIDSDAVFAEIEKPWVSEEVRKTHQWQSETYGMFGVPTFVVDDQAVFVRVMTRPQGDADRARSTIEHIIGLIVEHRDLNEFKHTTISR